MKVIKEITAEDQFTDPIQCGSGGLTLILGDSSSFSGTITVQATSSDFSGWVDNVTYIDETIDVINAASEISIRIGCKSGDYTSGSIKVAIYRDIV